MLRTLTGITGGLAGGIVLGAAFPSSCPIRADSMEVRMASCVLASLLVVARATGADKAAKPAATARPAETARAAA